MSNILYDSREPITFISAFLSGDKFLNLHLSSIRKFHPSAEIIISGYNGAGRVLTERYGGRFYNENLDYYAAVEMMFVRASNDTIVVSDCDTVLFSNVSYLAKKLDTYDIVGIEEKIKNPFFDKWERYAPGYMDMNFFMFNRKKFKSKISNWPKFRIGNLATQK